MSNKNSTKKVIIDNSFLVGRNKNRNDTIQPRPRINKGLWSMFRGIAIIKDLSIESELNEMIRWWIEDNQKYVDKKCDKCGIKIEINENFYTWYLNDVRYYYCSFEHLKEHKNEMNNISN